MSVDIKLQGLTGFIADLQSVLDIAQSEAYESVTWQGGDYTKTSIPQYPL